MGLVAAILAEALTQMASDGIAMIDDASSVQHERLIVFIIAKESKLVNPGKNSA